jgi:triosephosphate isomerase
VQKQVIGNWKMNTPPAGIEAYLGALAGLQVSDSAVLAVAPPFPFISSVGEEIRRRKLAVSVGAQNCSERPSGAFTGEVSAGMVQAAGASFVIVGHSERRGIFGETDDLVRKKLEAVVKSGLVPVLCIGESLEVREAEGVEPFLAAQLEAALHGWTDEVVVAYEPIWAIGTGRNATGEMVAETGRFIRRTLNLLVRREVALLYGGSVTDDNVDELVRDGGIDGFLVGGASLDAGKFGRIYTATAGKQTT